MTTFDKREEPFGATDQRIFLWIAPALGLSVLTQVKQLPSEGRPVDDFGRRPHVAGLRGRTPPRNLNTSIMLHLGSAPRAYYDGRSSPPVPHDVLNAAVPVDRQPTALSACDPRELRPESFDLGRQKTRPRRTARRACR